MQGGQPIIAHFDPDLLEKTTHKQNGGKLGSRILLILRLRMPLYLCSGVFTCSLISYAYARAYALVKTSLKGSAQGVCCGLDLYDYSERPVIWSSFRCGTELHDIYHLLNEE